MDIEFTRLAVIYIHLIACCVAIGMVFTSDVAMVRHLLSADATYTVDAQHLQELQSHVTLALLALWLSGLVIISLDAATKGPGYFANPKLQAKIAVVVLLSFNGAVLHRCVLPYLQRAGSVLWLPMPRRLLALFAGSVSGVSWFYAALLGVGKPLSWRFSIFEILAAYPLLIVGGFIGMTLLTAWALQRITRASARRRRRTARHYDFQQTMQIEAR